VIFVYGTDLHGDRSKYRALSRAAMDRSADLLVAGADVLPKGNSSTMLEDQRRFLGWLKSFSSRCPCPLYFGFGNDDLRHLVGEARAVAASSCGTLRLLEPRGTVGGVGYMSYPHVPEYPFGLKDWVKFDTDSQPRPDQLGPPVVSCEDGFRRLAATPEYAEALMRSWGTMRADLEGVSRAEVAFVHAPPAGMDLDVCYDGRAVGSLAVREWILRCQPLVSLHGHIHESYGVTGVWSGTLGPSLVVQPGDGHYAVVTVHGGKASAAVFKY